MEELSGTGFDLGVHLWILLFGGVHSRGPEAVWYRGTIRELCEAKALLKWDDIKLLVSNLPWVQKDVETCLKDFYESCTVNDSEVAHCPGRQLVS